MTKTYRQFLTGGLLSLALFTFAPTTHGQIRPYAWGHNGFGQIGDNTTVQRILPVLTAGVLVNKTVVALAGGQRHSLALCSDGTVAAWGNNTFGMLGNGTSVNSSVPVAVTMAAVLTNNNKTVIAIGAGIDYSLALCSDGTVASWGINTFGQLGNGTTYGSQLPQAVMMTGALSGKLAKAIAAGSSHGLALFDDGTVAAWGLNSNGQIGDGSLGSPAQRLSPVLVSGAGALNKAIAAGAAHSLALRQDGTVAAWGFNNSGALGNNSTVLSLAPVLVDTTGLLSGKTVVAIAAGGLHSVVLYNDGNSTSLASWGANALGQLGNGGIPTQSLVPVAVTTAGTPLQGRMAVAIAAGNRHTLALCGDGTLASWGNNLFGMLGDNSTTHKLIPVAVNTSTLPAGGLFTGVFSGSSAQHTLALASSGCPEVAIVCPASITTNTCGSNVVVNFAPPAVTGGTLQGCVPASGSLFDVGTSLVTCTATNACSTNICTFSVTVVQGQQVLFVSEPGNYTIQKFTMAGIGSPFADANDALSAPYGLAFDNNGLLYVANSGNNTIRRFDSSGNGTLFAGVAGQTTLGLSGPSGLAFDSAGTTLYVANLGDGTIWKFATSGGPGVIFANTGLSSPTGLAFDAAGDLYVANQNDNTIIRFTTAGSGLHVGSLFASADLNQPIGLAFDSAGLLYVANYGNHTVRKFTSSFTSSLFAGVAGSTSLDLNGPAGLAFDNAGNLYVANFGNNTIGKFTSGVGSVFADASDGLSAPLFIALRNICVDLAPPTITCPAAISLNVCGNSAVVSFASPYVMGGVFQSCVPASSSSFGLGTNLVTCTATNAYGTNTCTFTVTVTQIPAVAITCPAPIVTNTCGSSVVVNFVPPTVTGGALQSCSPASGSSFVLGTNLVTCTATNACGTNVCAFTVTVTQIPAVAITCPPSITTNICGSSVIVNFAPPTVTGGALQSCSPVSGSPFALGTNLVTCTATNACGTNTCTFTVTVTQTPAVAITCPASITTNACGGSVVVNFAAPTITGGALQSCIPASGSSFILGTNLVTCTATNACSTNACTFTVTVQCPTNLPSCLPMINPSFEANTFTVLPGYSYVSGNGPITGWTSPGSHGVNPVGGANPFADNGAIPDGNQVAFLQEDGALSQMVGGFTVGAEYCVQYDENSRDCCVPCRPWR